MQKFVIYIVLFIFGISYGQNYSTSSFTNPFAQNQFVPNISLIGDFSYVNRNIKDSTYKSLGISGFVHEIFHSHSGHEHAPINAERGFNFNYGELAITSTVDPYFDLVGIFHLTEHDFAIEELYFTTRSLPYNLQLKGGKFLSSIGRINQQHQHYWDFVDIPLVYKVLFGDEGLNEKGVQLTWIAPTSFYLLLGIEVLQGENELSFGYEVVEENGNTIFDKASKPNLYTAIVKSSYDIGNLTLLGGLSYLTGKARFNHLDDEEEPHAFGGDSNIYGIDLTVKYFLDAYRYISVQGEYFYRDLDGKVYKNSNFSNLNKKQGGFYIQTVYRFSQRWRTGFRYDLLNKNEINGQNKPDDLDRYSFMIEFTPSEFSRIRFQYNYDRSKFLEDERKKINEFIVEFNLVIGAHGAHAF